MNGQTFVTYENMAACGRTDVCGHMDTGLRVDGQTFVTYEHMTACEQTDVCGRMNTGLCMD